MILDPLVAHAVCAALVLLDQGARALRIKLLTNAIGQPYTFRQGIVTNTVGDAACAVTPMRIGGEPARLGVMLHFGVPATASFIAVAFEVITMWPVTLACAAAVAILFAPGWLEHSAPALLAGLAGLWGWLLLAGVGSVVIWLVVRRSVHVAPRMTRRPWHRARVYWRRMPRGPLVASAFLSFVNLATRTAILPVLMMTLPEPPPLGPAILGSFALLYSQLVLPTPSGAGVVDLGLLAGAAGQVQEGEIELLVWWRFYTSAVGILLGGWAAVRTFGWEAVRRVVRRSTGRG
jgi:uncharacterized membrane protein YbhN (UPF0104 family)